MLVFSYPLVELRAPSKLSRAEAAVAIAVVSGLAVAEVARERQTAVRTVANQLRSVYAKLGVRSRTAAALFAMRHGMIATAGETEPDRSGPDRKIG